MIWSLGHCRWTVWEAQCKHLSSKVVDTTGVVSAPGICLDVLCVAAGVAMVGVPGITV